MRSIFIGLTCFGFLVFHSCTKHNGDMVAPPPAATISYSNPLPGAVFQTGDSITVQAFAIARNVVHGYDFSICKKNDTTKLYFKHVHDHNDTLVINQKWKNDLTAPADLEAKILLYLDHDGNTCSKTINFKIR